MKKVEFLAEIPLFTLMSRLELEAVSEFLEPRMYQKGATIFAEGDTGTEMFIVHTGIIGMYMTQSDGGKREQKPFEAKAFFGEMALVEGECRSATCYAIENSKLLVLSGLDFFRMVWDYPMLGVKLLKSMTKVMIERLSKASGFLDDMVRWGEIARRRAVTDDLSGLFNRRFLEESIKTRFSRGFGESRKCSLLMIDFDKFRDINLTYGTMAGDAVITNAGALIQRIVGENHIPARLSGDEFAILLPDAGITEALQLAETLQAEIAALYLEFRTGPGKKPEKVILTLSIGVASCPEHAKTESDLFHAADQGLYRAKKEGRNRVCRYLPIEKVR